MGCSGVVVNFLLVSYDLYPWLFWNSHSSFVLMIQPADQSCRRAPAVSREASTFTVNETKTPLQQWKKNIQSPSYQSQPMCKNPASALPTIKPNTITGSSVWQSPRGAAPGRPARQAPPHMRHQLSVWAVERASANTTSNNQKPPAGPLKPLYSWSLWEDAAAERQRSAQQFTIRLIHSCMFRLIFNLKMKLHIHGFKWNSLKAACASFPAGRIICLKYVIEYSAFTCRGLLRGCSSFTPWTWLLRIYFRIFLSN